MSRDVGYEMSKGGRCKAEGEGQTTDNTGKKLKVVLRTKKRNEGLKNKHEPWEGSEAEI